MEAIETIEYRGFNINIYQDSEGGNPREWDNLGKIICFHSRYNIGDKHDFPDNEQFKIDIIESDRDDILEILPVYMYDHGGITINTTGFHCPWDSGQVGWIYCDKESQKAMGTPIKLIKEQLINEVKEYDLFLTGQCYGYDVESTEETEHIEVDAVSCWGFLEESIDDSYMLKDAKSHIDYVINKYNQIELAKLNINAC